MDNVVDKKLSRLSRGIGTQSGQLIRETPIYSSESPHEFDLTRERSKESLDDLFLLRISGKNTGNVPQFHQQLHKQPGDGKGVNIHKTFSTRLGSLILYTDSFYLGKKQKNKRTKKKQHREIEELQYDGTVEELADSILRFGDGNFIIFSGKKGIRDEKVVSVRPGYSPIRYIASVSKLWNPERVEKLLEENALKEHHLQRYKKIKLPKIDIVPSSDYDPLLRDRPKPYTHTSLPDLFHPRDPAPSRVDNDEDQIEDASSGYAKSYISDTRNLERRRLVRKKPMQMNRLDINMPKKDTDNEKHRKILETAEEQIGDFDDDMSDSISDWTKLVEKSRNVVDKTFDDLFERRQEEEDALKGSGLGEAYDGRPKHGGHADKGSPSNGLRDEQSLSSVDYASLDPQQKAELISHLLLQGIGKEASTVEQLMSDGQEEKGTVSTEKKIDLSEQVSFPAKQRLGSFSDSGSVRGFRGNALHSSLPSTNSKASSKPKSLKDSLVISSLNKLPPIQSEPVTPNVNGKKESAGDLRSFKLPVIPKRGTGLLNTRKSHKLENEKEGENLFVGGRGIEVNDVRIEVKDDQNEDEADTENDDGEDLIKAFREKVTAEEEQRGLQAENEGSPHQMVPPASIESSPGKQTPDSGRSTGTGLTGVSDLNAAQPEEKPAKEPMTPVAEESSRSSKASKTVSRESTLNGTKSSVSERQRTFERDRSSHLSSSISKETREERVDKESSDLVGSDHFTEERGALPEEDEKENEGAASVVDKDEDVVNNVDEGSLSKAGSFQGHDVAESTSSLQDEGVYVEEEQADLPIETKDAENDELPHEATFTDTKTVSDSIDIVIEEDMKFDDAKTITGSLASRSSSGLLQVQAKTAAEAALSRPRSGLDLIEDMKIAASEFGKLFSDNILREVSKSSLPRRRTRSDAHQKIPRLKNKNNRSSSISVLSQKSSKRMEPVDVDSLKANVTGLGAMIDKKIADTNRPPTSSNKEDKDMEEKEPSQGGHGGIEEDHNSLVSFPAVSSKSDTSPNDIQMDIISYVAPDREGTGTDLVIHKDTDVVDASDSNAIETHPDTDEEEFQQALQAIVEEVKDLKEKKPPKGGKRIRKLKPGPEEKHNIVRDRMSASPPFLAGKVKDSKAPKGLGQIEETKKKTKGKAAKKSKESVKKVKVKKDNQRKKKVTFSEKVHVGETKEPKTETTSEQAKEPVAKTDDEDKEEEAAEEAVYDKYDVPITIKQAKVKEDSATEEEKEEAQKDDGSEALRRSSQSSKEEKQAEDAEAPGVLQKSFTFTSSTGNESDASLMVSGNDEGVGTDRHMDARMQKRKMEAERRRLKVEQRRREKEEAKRKLLEQAEREEKLKQEAEQEMIRRMEEFKHKKLSEEEEQKRKQEEEARKQRRLERERERERKEKEELKRKMAAMQAKLKLEEEMRREQERIAREYEEELRRQEEEKLKEMEEHERIEYEKRKREEEEERLRLEEERKQIEKEKRLREEEEHRIKMQKLEEFHRLLLERAKFWEGMKNSKWFLEWNQRLTEAFTFSYFDLLPAIMFQFTSLRPFTPKENKKHATLPPIKEERQEPGS